MKNKYVLVGLVVFFSLASQVHAAKPSDFGLKEGDLISAIFSDDPDVYIINDYGYKRLFLNPEIFKFYGHLGGFANVKLVTPEIRDAFITSGLFRDCESNDPKAYGVEVNGEDTGDLRWVNTTGEQAVKDDPNFFKKVFCINNNEFNWYPKGSALGTVKDIPSYERMGATTTAPIETITASSSLKEVGQVIICHYPPGNTSKPETITIGASAVKAHLINGDAIGECPRTTPTPTPTISPTPTVTVSPTPTPISSTSTCVGGDGRVPGLPICLMPENLLLPGSNSEWNQVDNMTGQVIGGAVCSVAICGRNGEWRNWPSNKLLNGRYYSNGYPENSTYIQTPFSSAYWGRYFTNGVWEVNGGGIVQPGSSQIIYPTSTPIPSTTASPSPTASASYSPTPNPTPSSTPTPTPISTAPLPPPVPGGFPPIRSYPLSGNLNHSVISISVVLYPDPNGDMVKGVFDWGDGTTSEGFTEGQSVSDPNRLLIPASGGTRVSAEHSYSAIGIYSIKVKAIDATNLSSAWTPSESVTIGIAPNQPVLTVTVTGLDVILNWIESSTDVTGFKLYDLPSSGGWRLPDVGASVRTYTDSGRAPGTYEYYVQAYNLSGGGTTQIYSSISTPVWVTVTGN